MEAVEAILNLPIFENNIPIPHIMQYKNNSNSARVLFSRDKYRSGNGNLQKIFNAA